MPGVAASRVLERLDGVKSSGDGWVARCPAHDDKIQSLKVDERNDGSVLLHCHAGCLNHDLLTALGLTFADLFCPPIETTTKRVLVKAYDYCALDGTLLYQSLRFLPKDFGQRRPDGKGGWIWNMKSLSGKHVPYRLPELKGHTLVCVVEGEKDADTLWSLGLPATCNIGGAGKWGANEMKHLKAAGCQRVVIFPDNDEAGEKHAVIVASTAKTHGISYNIIPLDGLKDHGDVSDWIADGHTKADLQALISAQKYVVQMPPPAPNSAPDLIDVPAPPEGGLVPDAYHLTDLGSAEAFRDRFGDLIRWDRVEENWYMWDGHRWKQDDGSIVRRLTHEHVRKWQIEAAHMTNYERRRVVLDFTVKQERSGGFDSLMREAKVLDPILVSNEWDNDPWLLGVRNGVIDLKTGQLRAGARADMVTKQVNVEYNPIAECPRWIAFLHEVFDGDTSMVEFLQRAIGYSLTGLITEQCFFMTSGSGSNGKSTMLVLLDYLFGDYSHTTDIRTFTVGGDGVRYELAQLASRRLILTSEARTQTTMNEQVLKNFTGGERVEAQHKYGHPFSFRPIGKIWFAVNHTPKVTDESYGFWRRVRLIPFDRTFAGSAMDRELVDKLKAEASGILSWAIDGCALWQTNQLAPPLKVMSATDAYQESEDPLAEFWTERCLTGSPDLSIGAMALYTAYRSFAVEQGIASRDLMTAAAFGKQVGRKFQRVDTNSGKRYRGVALKADGGLYGEDE